MSCSRRSTRHGKHPFGLNGVQRRGANGAELGERYTTAHQRSAAKGRQPPWASSLRSTSRGSAWGNRSARLASEPQLTTAAVGVRSVTRAGSLQP